MFELKWVPDAQDQYQTLREKAEEALKSRVGKGKRKSSKDEGLYKQVHKTLKLLRENPKHPGLHSHPFDSLQHPYNKDEKVWESYAQNRTPSAYRIFWCYGPCRAELTIIAITPHP